ncbi:MAG: hypothetical protein PF445_02830, partial [Melioribacteraceae bacterium]|nr:hypothetical protein [Melioribacteraceae bacterium]
MIKTPTIFILGAGASKPYGFPTGYELRENIIDNCINRVSYFKDFLPLEYQNQASNFVDKFNQSSDPMIDYFLKDNPAFHNIGKLAIYFEILFHESKSAFNENCFDREDDWMSFLFHKMTKDISNKTEIENIHNNVTFITFNYDRSLEYFFSKSLQKKYDLVFYQTYQFIKNMNIFHINIPIK